jgi:hypothetical protein
MIDRKMIDIIKEQALDPSSWRDNKIPTKEEFVDLILLSKSENYITALKEIIKEMK